LNKRFEETGTVAKLSKSGRPKTALTDENLQTVAEALVVSLRKSTRDASGKFQIAKSGVQRILRNIILKP
jgi:hypothetical protein